LIPDSVPPKIRPYRYPNAQKSEIKHMIVEILEVSLIHPSQSSFSTPLLLGIRRMDHGTFGL